MSDFGHHIEFGYFLIPDADDPGGVLETARLADRLGYDLLGVQDHPYQPTHLDALALLGVILAQTERIRVFQDVGNLPLRPPAVFAKAAATLDLLSGGRFEAGLGGGAYLQAAEAMGAPALTPGRVSTRSRKRSRSCARAGATLPRCASTAATTVSRARDSAPSRRTRSASGSAPRSRARSRSPAVGRRLGRPLMSSYLPPAAAAEAQTIIDRAARQAGRDPGEIRRIYNVPGAFTSAAPAPASDSDQAIIGPPEHWAEVLSHLAVDLGFGTFLLIAPPDPDTLRIVRRGRRPTSARARRDRARSRAAVGWLGRPTSSRSARRGFAGSRRRCASSCEPRRAGPRSFSRPSSPRWSG